MREAIVVGKVSRMNHRGLVERLRGAQRRRRRKLFAAATSRTRASLIGQREDALPDGGDVLQLGDR
jgi:DNA-binding MarR family transcriptional regulator